MKTARLRTRATRQNSVTRSRLALARQNPAPVLVSYVCPVCGGAHARSEHELEQLRTIRSLALEQLRRADDPVRERELEALIDRLDARLGLDPKRERRLRLAAEKSPTQNRR